MPPAPKPTFCQLYPKLCQKVPTPLPGPGPTPPIIPAPDVLKQEILDVLQALETELETNFETPNINIVLNAAKVFQRLQMPEQAIRLTQMIPAVLDAQDLEMTLANIEVLTQATQLRSDMLSSLGRDAESLAESVMAKNLNRIAVRMHGLSNSN